MMFWQALIAFLKENIILAIFLALFVLTVIRMMKNVVKWALVVGAVMLMVVYGVIEVPKIVEDMSKQAVSYTKDQALEILLSSSSLKYTENGNTYVIAGKNQSIQLKGVKGSKEAVLLIGDKEVKVNVDDTLKRFIEKAKYNDKLEKQ